MTKLPLYFFFSYLSSTFHYLFNHLSSDFTLIVEEFSSISRNQVFNAAEFYLRTKVSPSSCLRVSKTPKQKLINILIEKGEEINDEFEGIKIKWRFIYIESKGDHFHNKFKDIMVNSYLPYVLFKANLIKYDIWGFVNLEHPATFETLAMEPKLKKEVIDNLDRFVRRRDLYKKVGRAWKRGYLLYGPSGTRKSSLIAAMANYLKFDIYDLELTSIFNNSDLRRVLLSTSNRSIFFILPKWNDLRW
ncbi:hypothetical protein UlMin_040581 [Ulmus minor]